MPTEYSTISPSPAAAIQHRLTCTPGHPLPSALRQKMESVFNADLSTVRIFTGSEAGSIGALAFAHGEDLHFAPGLYSPDTYWGQQLLGHELTHVLQQRAGLVNNPSGVGIDVVQDDALEAEADRMGHQAASYWQSREHSRRVSAEARIAFGSPRPSSSAACSVIQCMFTGLLAGKLQPYFAMTFGATYKEFTTLQKSPTQYSTNEAITTALQALRQAVPMPAPVNLPPPLPVAPPSIPANWVASLGSLVLYRAVDLEPGKIKNKERFSPRTNPVAALPNAIRDILRDPRGFAEGHVRANYDFVHSAAVDETCAGYQDQRAYVYRITVPQMTKYDPPAGGSLVGRPPIIWADSAVRTLAGATKLAFDPRKVTNEVDLVFDVTLPMIDAYKPRGAQNWIDADWDNIAAIA